MFYIERKYKNKSKQLKRWEKAVRELSFDPVRNDIAKILCSCFTILEQLLDVLRKEGIMIKDEKGRALPHPALKFIRDFLHRLDLRVTNFCLPLKNEEETFSQFMKEVKNGLSRRVRENEVND